MLRRQASLEQVEATSGQDQCSLRLIDQETDPSATQLLAPSSLRRFRLDDSHLRLPQAVDTFGQAMHVPSPAERDHVPQPAFNTSLEHSQDASWSSQNRKVVDSFRPEERSYGIDSSAPEFFSAKGDMPAKPVWMSAKDTDTVVGCSNQPHPGARRFREELKRLATHGTIHGWTAGLSTTTQIDDFIAFFGGPLGSPYEGGVFYVRFKMPDVYPYKPPVCQMLTRIYHPNVDARGRIWVDILYDQRGPQLTTTPVLVSLASLLNEPSVLDPLVPEIAEQYLRDPVRYEQIASDYTRRYATGALPQTSDHDGEGQPWWTDAPIAQETQPMPNTARIIPRYRKEYASHNGS